MPGIAGILTEPGLPGAHQLLQTMLKSMMHQPFYAQASYVDQNNGWFAGSVSICGSFADGMPLRNETRTVALMIAGECFPGAQAKTALKCHSHQFDPGNASYLVHLYEEEGPEFVKKLNGLVSGVLLDSNGGKAILFNDRYGLQRIYCHSDASGFYFASEAKALLAALPHLRKAEIASFADYLCFDCVLEGRSYFRGVSVLPPGALWVSERGRVDRKTFFDPSRLEGQPSLGVEEFFDRFSTTFNQAVRRRAEGDKIGLALTGGLDSRFIMSCLPRDYDNVSAFSYASMYRDTTDVCLAREVSQACNIPHHTLRLEKDFLSNYYGHAARAIYLTDGLADATNVDSLFLSGNARHLAPIKLSGAFGSQVLGRVKRALRCRTPSPALVHPDFRPNVAEACGRLTPWRDEHDLSFCLKRETPWYWSRFIASDLLQFTLRLPFLDNDFIDLLYRAPLSGYDGSDFEFTAACNYNPRLRDIRTNKGLGGKAPSLVSPIIQKLIRARALTEKVFTWDNMPHSLHHFAARVDALMLSPLHLNWLILGREYYRHYNHWFRNDLAACLRDMVLDSRTLSRPYWNTGYLAKMVDDHVRGRQNNMRDIRKVVTIELIHRELLDGPG